MAAAMKRQRLQGRRAGSRHPHSLGLGCKERHFSKAALLIYYAYMVLLNVIVRRAVWVLGTDAICVFGDCHSFVVFVVYRHALLTPAHCVWTNLCAFSLQQTTASKYRPLQPCCGPAPFSPNRAPARALCRSACRAARGFSHCRLAKLAKLRPPRHPLAPARPSGRHQ